MNVGQYVSERLVCEAKLHGAGFEARQVEDIRNEGEQIVAVLADQRGILVSFLFADIRIAACKQIREPYDSI